MSEIFITCLVHTFVHLILDAYKYTDPWVLMHYKTISFKTPDKIFFYPHITLNILKAIDRICVGQHT